MLSQDATLPITSDVHTAMDFQRPIRAQGQGQGRKPITCNIADSIILKGRRMRSFYSPGRGRHLPALGDTQNPEPTESTAHGTDHLQKTILMSKLTTECSDLYCGSLIMSRSKTNAYHKDVQLLASQLLLGIVEDLLLEDGGERREEHGCHIDSCVHKAYLLQQNTIPSVP